MVINSDLVRIGSEDVFSAVYTGTYAIGLGGYVLSGVQENIGSWSANFIVDNNVQACQVILGKTI